MRLSRWWDRVAGVPARALMRLTSSELPHRSHDGFQLVVGDIEDAPRSERFFSRTVAALDFVASMALGVHEDLRQDLHQIVLWREGSARPYQKYLLAAVVPPRIAFESTAEEYAAWLVDTSATALVEQAARARVAKFLACLDVTDASRIAEWLARVRGGSP